MKITLAVRANAIGGASPVNFTLVNVSNDAGMLLPIESQNGTVTLAGPTAASVSIGGRVLTSTGRGIRGVILSLTDLSGQTRTAISTTFGYYRFEDMQAGETYIISAKAKHYVFRQPTQVLNINEDTDDINFIGTTINFVGTN